MAKIVYKIPADLAASHADMELAIQTKGGIGARPLPVKVIMTYVCSVVILFYLIMNSFISRGNPMEIRIFVLLWLAMTVLLASFDTTKQMQIQLIPVLLEYIPKINRKILTRTSSTATPFYHIAGMETIDNDGLVHFSDGTLGYWYRVVGSASILLFDGDRDAILDRDDLFWRKISPDCEILFMTTKEAQQVYKQVAYLKRRYENLTAYDPDLTKIANEQLEVLREYVGTRSKSIHQYMLVKGDNMEALMRAKQVIQSEYENSALIFKQCQAMLREDIEEILAPIYQGKQNKLD